MWGKGIVIEQLFHIAGNANFPPAVVVLWTKPRTMKSGHKMVTLKIYERDLTIISEVEE